MGKNDNSFKLLKHVQCYPNKCNCELMQSTFPVQPWSTYSNIPLLIFGFICILKKRYELKIQLLGISYVFTAVGSIALHGTFTLLGQILDFAGIALVLTWMTLWYYFKSSKKFLISFMASSVLLFSFLSLGEWTRFLAVTLVSIFLLGSLYQFEYKKPNPQQIHLKQALIAITFGVILFVVDNKQIWCGPHELLHGHLWWHLIGLFSMYKIFKYYSIREENKY
jgi:hypothetical protein